MQNPLRSLSRSNLILLGIGTVLALAAGARVATMRDVPNSPLTAKGEARLVVMNFATPFTLSPPPRGWTHHKFWTRPAMQLSFATKDGVPSLRCETNGGGSIFGRWTNIDLATYPKLSWRWRVETPIASTVDERTAAGDDHPIRWFLGFADSEGKPHHAEIVWGNKQLHRGDWKVLGTFVHYVADGGDENVGTWRDQTADLLAIYRKASGRTDTPRLTQLSLFCDSDETAGRSDAYLGGPVVLSAP